MNTALWILTGTALLVSLCCDRGKTIKALKMSVKRLWKISLLLSVVILIFSFSVSSIPHSLIGKTIGAESGLTGLFISICAGSVALMPGFIAFPLCAMLKTQGVPYYILAGFSVALMNVGILSFPLQNKYFGFKVAIIRNVIGFFTAILIAVIIGFAFGEIAL